MLFTKISYLLRNIVLDLQYNDYFGGPAALHLWSANPIAASKDSQLVASTPLSNTLENDERHLRVSTTEDEGDEERGISAKIPGLEKISSALKSSKTKKLQGLIDADESLGSAFTTVRLRTMSIGKNGIETEMVVKFFSSPNFKAWSNYATKTNPHNPQEAMLTTLKNAFGEKEVATMILLGKHTRSSKNAATKLEKVQFDTWIIQKKTPNDVIKDVMGVKPRIVKKYARVQEIAEDYGKYRIAKIFGIN